MDLLIITAFALSVINIGILLVLIRVFSVKGQRQKLIDGVAQDMDELLRQLHSSADETIRVIEDLLERGQGERQQLEKLLVQVGAQRLALQEHVGSTSTKSTESAPATKPSAASKSASAPEVPERYAELVAWLKEGMPPEHAARKSGLTREEIAFIQDVYVRQRRP